MLNIGADNRLTPSVGRTNKRQPEKCSKNITFTFMHLADAFIQSDMQAIIFFSQYVCSLGI